MPLKLQPPRPSQPNYVVRGTYLGHKLHRSTQTRDRKAAERILATWRREIEGGSYAAETDVSEGFTAACTSYMRAGGERRFIPPLVRHFGTTPLVRFTQAVIDAAAVTIYPRASPATRNRQVYSPTSAVLRHAGVKLELRRPKGARGRGRKTWLTPEQAFAFLAAAEAARPRFGALCTFLLYTGCRLSEALRLRWEDVDLPGGTAYVVDTKNGDPRMVFLPPDAVAALTNLDRAKPRVFRYAKSGALYEMFEQACATAGVKISERVAFHVFRHTWAAWMLRYAGASIDDLLATDAWKSRQQAAEYAHIEVQASACKAALLPRQKRA
jgi:integrase